MQCGTPRGDLISTEASLQAPSFATVMDGPEAAPVSEMGGKPVPAKTVMYPPINLFSRVRRDPVVQGVYKKDSVWAPPSTGGHGGFHVGGQEVVSRQP